MWELEGAQIKPLSDPFYHGLMTFWEGSKELSCPPESADSTLSRCSSECVHQDLTASETFFFSLSGSLKVY